MDAHQGTPLFEHCVFGIVPSRDIPSKSIAELKRALEDHAGEVCSPNSNGTLKLGDLTHLISNTSDFPQYSESQLQMIPVVKAAWVTASLLRNKQAPVRPFSPDPDLIFSSVVIACADIPNGDRDAIVGAVLALGGMESSSVTKMTTHICALTMEHPKCHQAKARKLNCQIVLPHWFDDCLKLRKRIHESPYLLPDPEIFRKHAEDAVPIPATLGMQGATSPRPQYLPTLTDAPGTCQLDVFKDKIIMLSDDLNIGSRLKKILTDLIVAGGGSIAGSVHDTDVYVCHWRDGRDYVFASRAGIDVGNLSWLYYLIARNQWTSPLRRLLHYPVPRGSIPGFEKFRITLSNYGGEARSYLENLVQVAGGEFTKSMKQDNTHLITARNSSEKCKAAEEWNINMVNHLWLEESYARCEVQKLTDPRYTHFPPRTNLGEVIGQTQFDASVLEALYFPRDPTPLPGDPKVLRRRVMHEKDRNSSSSKLISDQDAANNADPAKDKNASDTLRIKAESIPSAQNVTPLSRRVKATNGKENNTPSSVTNRSAKDKALSRLHGLAPDIALYEKERKRKGSVWGGERAATKIDLERGLDRSSSPPNQVEHQYSNDGPTPKRHRPSLPLVEIRLLITGYKGWLGDMHKEDTEKKKLREMGILIVQDARSCTHLAAPAIVRTQKFLCALAGGPTVVSSDFIDTCLKKGKISHVENFILRDVENEKRFGMKLEDILIRARLNNRHLLVRIPVYCTNEAPNGSDTYKAIVEANGGAFTVYRARSASTIKPTRPEEDDGEPEPVYLITGPKPEERRLWPKFEEMAKAGNMISRIVHPEWLLDVAMSQQIKWSSKYLATRD